MDNNNPYIVGFGIACVDYLFVVPSVTPGGYAPIKDFTIQGGGLTGTAVVACSRLGARARMLGRVGDDQIGDQVIEGLNAENVDTTGMIRVAGGKTFFAMVMVDADTAERTIYGRSDSGMDCDTDLINTQVLEGADAVVLDHHWADGSRVVAKRARELGIAMICDMDIRPETNDLLALCDYPIIPRASGLKLSETGDPYEALGKIRAYGPRAAVITCGEEGAYYQDEYGQGHVRAFKIDAIDTTGAGDVFHGAFAVGLTHGWALREIVTFASAVSAIKCMRVGGRTGIPSFDQAMEFLGQRGVRLP